jgi:HEPN domain-containing protein
MNAQPVEEWLKKAEDNYVSALALARRRSRPVPDVVCNQCQQCAEKYLKALLVRHQVDFPKVHDLVQLEELVAQIEPDIRLVHRHLAVLNPYGIDIRYPGLEATVEEAREAVRAIKEIRRFVRPKLGLDAR